MVQFLAGSKGEGKTQQIIGMANEKVQATDGNLVFIDDDIRHSRDVHRDIRFVATGKGRLSSCQGLTYFIWGMLTQNSDIKHIYVDGLTNIVREEVCDEKLVKFKNKLVKFSEEFNLDFTVTMHSEKDSLPDEIKALVI